MPAFTYADRIRANTATTGTGTLNPGSAVSGFRSFDDAYTAGMLPSGSVVPYGIDDGPNWEDGYGTYTHGSPSTLTRTVIASSNSNAAISLSGSAVVYLTPIALGLTRNALDFGLYALTYGATINTDCSKGNVFTVTLTGNATLATPTNMQAGATYQWIIKQDATGGRTLSYGTAFWWANKTPPTLSTGANAQDIITAIYDGTKLNAVLSTNFG